MPASPAFQNSLLAEGRELRQQLTTRGNRYTNPADRRLLSVASAPRGEERLEASRLTMSPRKPGGTARPVAPYLGGKRNLAKRVCRIIDAHPHATYAEPFVGMGGIFLRRTSAPRAEFINDLNQDVYNLFRILQEHYVAFLDYLRFQITTQANFNRLVGLPPDTLTDLQRAARFLFLQRTAFGGKVSGRNFGISPDRPARFNLTTLEPDLEALHSRLSAVTITCLDFRDFIRRIDRPDALFYLDPPYWGSETDYGRDRFARCDFPEMAAFLQELQGDFILSINDVPDIRALFAWATIVPVSTAYTVSRTAKDQRAAELIISSLPEDYVRSCLYGTQTPTA